MALLYKTFEMGNRKYVFDGNTNAVLVLSDEDFGALKDIEENPNPQKSSLESLARIQETGFCCDVEIKEILHPCSEFLHHRLARKIEKITLQVTQRCNLRCSYCAYSGLYDNRRHGVGDMPFEIARKALDFAIEHSIDSNTINIGFYGGEPLLNLSLIKECLEYVKKNFAGKDISYSMTTNGTLLTMDTYEFLMKNGVYD